MAELIFLDLEWNTTFYRSRTGERLPFPELIEVAAINNRQKRLGYNAAHELLARLGMAEDIPRQRPPVTDYDEFYY